MKIVVLKFDTCIRCIYGNYVGDGSKNQPFFCFELQRELTEDVPTIPPDCSLEDVEDEE